MLYTIHVIIRNMLYNCKKNKIKMKQQNVFTGIY
jgi:hypothetical protein